MKNVKYITLNMNSSPLKFGLAWFSKKLLLKLKKKSDNRSGSSDKDPKY